MKINRRAKFLKRIKKIEKGLRNLNNPNPRLSYKYRYVKLLNKSLIFHSSLTGNKI